MWKRVKKVTAIVGAVSRMRRAVGLARSMLSGGVAHFVIAGFAVFGLLWASYLIIRTAWA